MPKIKFSKNWNNKLNCNLFSTIRKFTEEKAIYYKDNLNRIFEVELDNEVLYNAKLFDVKVCLYNDLEFDFLVYDTGIPSLAVIDRVLSKFGVQEGNNCIVLWFERVQSK